MDDNVRILVAIALGVLLLASLFLLVIPEPAERAVIATERLDVAVLGFRNSATWPGVEETLRSRIESRLVNQEGINVYSRAQLDALLMERALSTSGLLDPTTAVEIGTLTGVSKLITGTVYGVETRAEETTICVAWGDGGCTEAVPGIRYTARVLGQVQIIDASTGQIEKSIDLSGTASETRRVTDLFAGFSTFLAEAAGQMASDTVSAVRSTYTREVRYDLYTSVKTKRSGYVGEGATHRFTTDDEAAHLVVHFVRVRDADRFDIVWSASDGTEILRQEDVIEPREWRTYRLDLDGLPTGRYVVQGWLNGVQAFEQAFTVSR